MTFEITHPHDFTLFDLYNLNEIKTNAIKTTDLYYSISFSENNRKISAEKTTNETMFTTKLWVLVIS